MKLQPPTFVHEIKRKIKKDIFGSIYFDPILTITIFENYIDIKIDIKKEYRRGIIQREIITKHHTHDFRNTRYENTEYYILDLTLIEISNREIIGSAAERRIWSIFCTLFLETIIKDEYPELYNILKNSNLEVKNYI